jgi:hypothetical protein
MVIGGLGDYNVMLHKAMGMCISGGFKPVIGQSGAAAPLKITTLVGLGTPELTSRVNNRSVLRQ